MRALTYSLLATDAILTIGLVADRVRRRREHRHARPWAIGGPR